MISHLPVLLVATPLIAAPFCLILRQRNLVRLLATAVAACSLWASLMIIGHLMGNGGEALYAKYISYEVASWAPPLGIELRVDALNAFILLILSGVATVVFPYGFGTEGLSGPEGKEHLFYAAMLLCFCGLVGITVTGDAFNVFVFVEIASLSSYTLISLGKSRKATMAAFAYLVMGTIGGTFILIGIGFLFALTGTLNMQEIAARLPAVLDTSTAVVALAFLCLGTAIKLAIFPLYQWLPNAYTYAPSKVSAFLSATATKVSYYVLLRITFGLFGAAYVFGELHLDRLLLVLGIAAMFIGSTAAIYQTNVKRLLAYSSVAQIGYMILGIALMNQSGLTGGIVHLFNHALMKCGLFLAVGCVAYRVGSNDLKDFAGLMRQMPMTMWAFIVGGLSLIGVPGTVGFVSKWYLVMGALQAELYSVAVLTLLSSLLAVIYIWRVVEVAVFQKPEVERDVKEAPMSMLVPTWILMIAAVYFGFDTALTVDVAHTAIEALVYSGPEASREATAQMLGFTFGGAK
jgi:multicomponent Na+:H+ antiporter subunit D